MHEIASLKLNLIKVSAWATRTKDFVFCSAAFAHKNMHDLLDKLTCA